MVRSFNATPLRPPPFSLPPSDVADRKLTSDEEEAKRIAEMGKPVLGEHSKLEVIIEESYEFKVRDEQPALSAASAAFTASALG